MEADLAVREINEKEGYSQPVVRYRCRACGIWHVATARGHTDKRRSERARRKWLVRNLGQERHAEKVED